MKPNHIRVGLSGFVLLAVLGMAAIPAAAAASEDVQAEREARRLENEARREQELGRRDIEARERAQAEALSSQQAALQRMEAAQSRMEAGARQMDQRSAEQARSYPYPYSYSAPNVPAAPGVPLAPVIPAPASIIPDPRAPAPDSARAGHPVGRMSFAPLSERLKSYFGAQSGVLVVSAGADPLFGLQDGDVIISIDGRMPADGAHASQILRSYRSGERVKLRVQRDRRTIDVDAVAP